MEALFAFVSLLVTPFWCSAEAKGLQPILIGLPSESMHCSSNEDCLSSEICQRTGESDEFGLCSFWQQDLDSETMFEELPLALQVHTSASLNVSSLTIKAKEGHEAKMVLGDGTDTFTLSLDEDSNFEISFGDKPVFSISKEGNILADGMFHAKGTLRVDGQLQYMGVAQFFLVAVEDFGSSARGWTNDTTSSCGTAKKMLGGYGKFSGGEVSKTFRKLPPHSEMRVQCNFNFIDGWTGEVAYAKIDQVYIWTDTQDSNREKDGVNVCGSPSSEARFASVIDVVVPHNATSVTITFGSTLDGSPFEQSWGVDDFMLYLR